MDVRVAAPRELEELLESLSSSEDKSMAPFESRQKVIMFAAAVGWQRSRSVPTEKRGSPIRLEIFENNGDAAFIDALAIAKTGDLSILEEDRTSERVKIFEEYVHGGLLELKRLCFDRAGNPLDILLSLAEEFRDAATTEIPGLDANDLRDLGL